MLMTFTDINRITPPHMQLPATIWQWLLTLVTFLPLHGKIEYHTVVTPTQVEESAQIPLKKMQEMTGMSGIWPEWAESIKKNARNERNLSGTKNARNERNLIGIKNAGNERNLTWPNERKHWNSRNRESMYTKYVKKVQVNLLEPISGKFSPEQVQAWLSEKFYIEQWKLVFLQK